MCGKENDVRRAVCHPEMIKVGGRTMSFASGLDMIAEQYRNYSGKMRGRLDVESEWSVMRYQVGRTEMLKCPLVCWE